MFNVYINSKKPELSLFVPDNARLPVEAQNGEWKILRTVSGDRLPAMVTSEIEKKGYCLRKLGITFAVTSENIPTDFIQKL